MLGFSDLTAISPVFACVEALPHIKLISTPAQTTRIGNSVLKPEI